MGSLPSLRSLYLSDNPLGDEGAKALFPDFKHLTQLKKLSLGGLKLSEEGFLVLLDSVSELTELRTLYLAENCFDPERASNIKKKFAELLPSKGFTCRCDRMKTLCVHNISIPSILSANV